MRKKIYLCLLAAVLALAGCGRTQTAEDEAAVPVSQSDAPQAEENRVTAEAAEDSEDGQEYTILDEAERADEPDMEEQPEEVAATEATESAPVDRLTYIDAWGEWHTNPIDTTCKMHNYDWSALKNDGQNISYEDSEYTIRKGVDISYHQGSVDFEKVKAAGYEFVILRAVYRGYGTSGSLNEDSMFRTYLKNAQAAGLDVGVYVFSQAINEAEALEEAELVLRLLDGTALELPVVYDPEFIRDDTARTDHVSGEQFTANTITFCEKIKQAGYEPMIYSNMIWEGEVFTMAQLQDYRFWYADYELMPQTPYAFDFWQYTSTGAVPGISGNVDLNIQFIKKGETEWH